MTGSVKDRGVQIPLALMTVFPFCVDSFAGGLLQNGIFHLPMATSPRVCLTSAESEVITKGQGLPLRQGFLYPEAVATLCVESH